MKTIASCTVVLLLDEVGGASRRVGFQFNQQWCRAYSSDISVLCSGTPAAFFCTLIGMLTFTVETLSA